MFTAVYDLAAILIFSFIPFLCRQQGDNLSMAKGIPMVSGIPQGRQLY
jgi:hypothetical protein